MPTVEHVVHALRTAGIDVLPHQVLLEARDQRWLVRLPTERLAWFADSEEGRQRLALERRVLRLLAERCRFAVPRVLFESADGTFDVRAMVPGTVDPWRAHRAVLADATLAARLGAAIGAILVEQHTRITAADAATWLPRTPEWSEPRSALVARLRRVVHDPDLCSAADRVMAEYEEVDVPESDRVLVHGDLGLHNLVIDVETHAVHGVFDYEGAAWADRHHDFRYLVFDDDAEHLFEAARTYEPAVARAIDPRRVRLYNAACALGFLAAREGFGPEERPCGRTLDEDLRWSRHALGRLHRAPG